MAHQDGLSQQHACIFRYQSFCIDKNQLLGHLSYGAVYKAKCDQLPCAAKLLHATILDPTDPGADKIMQRFKQEGAFLESVRHPNIVQYLCMTVDPESRLPVLLMELIDESLTKMLERSQQLLPYCVQVDICHDIALAVAYLHSIDIIHRDLSSNNVLMIAGRRAKVTDFGMSKLAGAAPTMTPLTTCPGTVAYMAPEALREPPRYTKKLDCFSEGVVMIQVCTRLWPEPGPRTKLVPDSRSPTGSTEMPVLETERRKNHIDLVNRSNALLPIAKDCLCIEETERPSSEEVCQRLAALSESSKYRASQQDVEALSSGLQVHEKDREIETLTNLLQQLEQQLLDKDSDLSSQCSLILNKDRQLEQGGKTHQEEVRHLKDEIASRDKQLRRFNKQLNEQEHLMTEIQQSNNSLKAQVVLFQQQLSQRSPNCEPHPNELNWSLAGKSPLDVVVRGAAVVQGHLAYFMNCGGEVCSYNSKSKKWSELPKYPYQYGSLVVINGQLTGIGGCMDIISEHTGTLLSLSKRRLKSKAWMEVFPPMPTSRRNTVAVASTKVNWTLCC